MRLASAPCAALHGSLLFPQPVVLSKEYTRRMSRGRRQCEYLLVDGQTAGSGETFDWTKLKVPRGASRKGFMLAGGLNPSNVAEAVRTMHLGFS